MAIIILPEVVLQSIIDGCIALQRDSQKRFYTTFYGYAFAVCHRYVPHEQDTLEVMNDAFLKIYKDINRFVIRNNNLEGSLKAWMRRICINTAIDHIRKHKHDYHTSEGDNIDWLAAQNADAPGSHLSHQELLAMIGRLTPAYRTVFNLFVIDGYSHEEISDILRIAPGTSKSNLAKARINLQKMIKNEEQQLNDYERQAI